MKTKGRTPQKHSGDHSSILYLLTYCIEEGDTTYEQAAKRIHENEWMNPESKTGSNYDMLKLDCKRSWEKAKNQTEAGVTDQKRLKEFEKLRFAKDWVDIQVTYDTFLNQYLSDGKPSSPAVEYDKYNQQADDRTFIEKHYFANAFEVDQMPRVNCLKEWGASLPKWDKKDWVKKLAAYLPAKDPRQAELFLKGWLIKTFIQGVNPEGLDATAIVNRWFFILHQHGQDNGKTGFLQWISPNLDWVKLSGIDESKDGYTALAHYLIVQDDELGGLSQARQHERIKAMISVSKVDVRPPYAAGDVNLPRVASFCGSTNNDRIFPSSEGTSRFLTLPLRDEPINWREYIKTIDRVKLWAQVKALAATDWLELNTPEITKYRNTTNANMVKESTEDHAVQTYVIESDSEYILQTGDVVKLLKDYWDLDRLNVNLLGQALRDRFGERVKGKTKEGKETRGYKVTVRTGDTGNTENAKNRQNVRKTDLFRKPRKPPQR